MLHLNTIDKTTYQTLLSFNSKEYLNNFSLVGGTNLSLRFGHRKSIDLDMFAVKKFDPLEINSLLEIDYAFKFQSNNKYMLFCYINNIKVDWVYHPFELLKPIEIIDGVRLFSVEDISAMKLFAVTKRGSKKDFFDIYKLCEILSPEKLFNNFIQKYGEENVWMVKMSLIYFEDADKEEDPEIIEKKMTWDKVKKYMINTFSPGK
jgi:predicted nucleotidyltransferase component of viral defense system